MKRWSRVLMVAIFVLRVLPVSAIAQKKQKGDSAELTTQELEQETCGRRDQQVNLSAGADKSKHPTPSQPVDQAWIYIVRPARVGMFMQIKLAVDGDSKGASRASTIFVPQRMARAC